ncbi:MAG: hypothetical protein ACI841_004341 [Planctomycetota bacterium]|jgi:hypothetical protein
MGLLHPELLLLALPALALWWAKRDARRLTNINRILIVLALSLAICGPYMKADSSGRDLIIVVDRSHSMPLDSETDARELIALAEAERTSGDRIGVVSFGGRPQVELVPNERDNFQHFEREVDADGSDLGAALETALNLIPDGRQGSILLLSDGESNGRDPVTVARRAFGRRLRIDSRSFDRPVRSDLSVDRIELPGDVAVGEAFQFNVWVHSDRRVEADFELTREGRVLASGKRVFEAGQNRIVLRDVLSEVGVSEYRVQLKSDDDRVPENDRGLGAVMARGARHTLVLNEDGSEDSLVRALRIARIPVAVSTPEEARLDPVGLSRFRGVIIENVAAARFSRGDLKQLREFVVDRGGGLMMTGGQAAFGIGGYHLSPIDQILPVSMEMRQEHRKLAVAMAIALDRSGSMGAPAGGGMTKMDLANLGTASAIELLSPMDSVAVIAVDSAHHIIQELTPVKDVQAITNRVRSIQAGGGGIFCAVALIAAGRELENAEQLNRHIILFSDAADSEEQERSREVLPELTKLGITLSVIALGTETDVDADFLKELAANGGGEVYFTTDPAELPRLFALDTMTAARSTFVDQPSAVELLPDLLGLGALPAAEFPSIGGYNLTYLRQGAQAGAITKDEYRAPLLSFSFQGLGRTAAYTGQVGGTYGAPLTDWDGFASFFVTVTRWILGNEEPDEFFTTVRREGQDAVIRVEIDPEAAFPPDTTQLLARLTDPSTGRRELVLERTGEFEFEARHRLGSEGVLLGSVQLDDERFVSLPPISLPYSPEFERSPDPEHGRRLLRRLARESGGEVGVTAASLFRGERGGRVWRLVTRELMIFSIVMLLIEIAVRRLSLLTSLRTPQALHSAREALQGKLEQRRAAAQAKAERVPAKTKRAESTPSAGTPSTTTATPTQADEGRAQARPDSAEEPDSPRLGSALSRAREAADRKLGRRPNDR